MKFKSKGTIFIALLLILSLLAGCQTNAPATEGEKTTESPETSDDPRQQTLFVTGMQWNPAQNFNWFSGWPAWPTDTTANPMVYEPLFLYNSVTDKLSPFLGESYEWVDSLKLKVILHEGTKFSDGEVLDTSDILYTLEAAKRYWTSWTGYTEGLEAIEVIDAKTIQFTFIAKNFNEKNALEMLARMPVLPEHIWAAKETEFGNEATKLAEFFNDSPVGSGAYSVDFHDETQIRTKRNDAWWGKDVHGLPAPKYITHLIYNSNDASTLDLKKGVLDYSQNFISKVWELKDSGVKTYLEQAPYYAEETLPTFFINLHKAGLNNVEVRRALAYALNYPDITDKAMNGYSSIIEPSLMVFDYEKAYLDQEQIKNLAWSYDVDKANAILDGIGAAKGKDGIRVLPDGTRLGPWKVECPAGWTEWNATIEIAAQNAKAVGIELVPSFTEWGVYDNNKSQGTFDLTMDTPAGYATPSGLTRRAHALLNSENVAPIGEAAYWNYGRYDNKRVNEILREVGSVTDETKKKELLTELNVIYLTDVPTLPLYYRPSVFYTFNETVWKNFPIESDGKNIPGSLFDGAGYLGLFELTN